MHNPAYVGPREDILRLVPHDARRVLDVGCSVGTLGQALRERGTQVTGIELDPKMGEEARAVLDEVHVGSVEDPRLLAGLGDARFDCIIFADLLEHLVDPWSVLRGFVEHLADDGVVVASLPNIRHYTTIRTLLFQGYWPYRERGIHDRTHLRFFTLRNIRELFASAGLAIRTLDRNYRIIERPHRLNRVSPLLALPWIRELIAFQYLVQAGRKPR
ncbi:MAG: methyltransferase domain-containing protein [Acidobacteria bacterium]|nr:methyltransferase domain-containing protein [Acidobacteriota bacterium]NIM61151.1 methyltransferase domain-containing protein [Acidobacteriota bacterium]NIO58026.1 methyltransferase domain-containing protein [Acidobacteriota bacterium]NIQ29033.1 methyltransferase domain-containing protein [Acidobacteriota bacterium]NIQ83559.1 methyltransferase domain-containing protein [Acidobacteriota bacterium]